MLHTGFAMLSQPIDFDANECSGWQDPGFWQTYQNDPEVIYPKCAGFNEKHDAHDKQMVEQIQRQVKAQEQEAERQAAEERAEQNAAAAVKRQRAAESELLQRPASNDWQLHNGNVSFCRSIDDFTEYHPIKATAILGQGSTRTTISVHGIGTVSIPFKTQLGQSGGKPQGLTGVLHIPAARCNGLSIPRFEKMGWVLKRREDARFVVHEVDTNRSVLCGNDTSGRFRVCMAGERDDRRMARYVTFGQPISLYADGTEICRLAPFAGYST